jgi:hypothetical protein
METENEQRMYPTYLCVNKTCSAFGVKNARFFKFVVVSARGKNLYNEVGDYLNQFIEESVFGNDEDEAHEMRCEECEEIALDTKGKTDAEVTAILL